MDSTYLCRGKRLDNEEWIVGYYTKETNGHFIIVKRGRWIKVDPATVGKCTGRKDKNGNLIFTGDKLKDSENYIWEVTFEQDDARFEMYCKARASIRLFDNDELYFSEIIGTIYEEAQPCGN